MTILWLAMAFAIAAGLYAGWKKFWKWFNDRWDADEDERHHAIIQGKKDDRAASESKEHKKV